MENEENSVIIVSSEEPDSVIDTESPVEKVYIPVVGADIPSTSKRKSRIGILSDFLKIQIIIGLSLSEKYLK